MQSRTPGSRSVKSRLWATGAVVGGLLAGSQSVAAGFTANENWFSLLAVGAVADSVTSDNGINGNAWVVDAGADSWSNDYYERPFSQQSDYSSGNFRAYKYIHQNLDITSGNYAFDEGNKIAYFRINLYGTLEGEYSKILEGKDSKPLDYEYRVLFNDGGSLDGGYMANSIQPGSKLGTTFAGGSGKELYVWKDGNNDLGTNGNGFEQAIVTSSGNDDIIQARKDAAGKYVDFAINYGALNLDLILFGLRFEAIKGLKDNQNYFWNDEYTLSQAGSPYLAGYGSDGSSTNVQNIYELDTTPFSVVTTVVPIPAAAWLLGSGLLGLLAVGRRRTRSSLTSES